MEFKQEVINLLIDKAVKMFGVDPATLGPETRFKEDLHIGENKDIYIMCVPSKVAFYEKQGFENVDVFYSI